MRSIFLAPVPTQTLLFSIYPPDAPHFQQSVQQSFPPRQLPVTLQLHITVGLFLTIAKPNFSKQVSFFKILHTVSSAEINELTKLNCGSLSVAWIWNAFNDSAFQNSWAVSSLKLNQNSVLTHKKMHQLLTGTLSASFYLHLTSMKRSVTERFAVRLRVESLFLLPLLSVQQPLRGNLVLMEVGSFWPAATWSDFPLGHKEKVDEAGVRPRTGITRQTSKNKIHYRSWTRGKGGRWGRVQKEDVEFHSLFQPQSDLQSVSL